MHIFDMQNINLRPWLVHGQNILKTFSDMRKKLCFRCKDSVKHFNVTWLGESEGYKFGMGVYPTLKEFIDHFDNQPLIAGESGS